MKTNATTMTAWVPKTFGIIIGSTSHVTGVSDGTWLMYWTSSRSHMPDVDRMRT